ncbi:MAG: beta-ketoacyl-[acyl-carrier-protein] synthase family protein [Candidatus Omnitrophota bacterium]
MDRGTGKKSVLYLLFYKRVIYIFLFYKTMRKRIAVTGIGVLAPNGLGKKAFWEALREGHSGIKRVASFDTMGLNSKSAGEISDLDPGEVLGKKGLRNLDRTTLLALCASKMALEDAGLPVIVPEEETDHTGVSLGSTMGSVYSISEFDKVCLSEGPRSVNPALFPNTVINSPASQISIKFNIKGFNSTICSGFCSGIDSIYYAVNMMELYEYHTVLAGGVEEMCEHTFKGFYKIGRLAGSRPGGAEVNCPYDKRRTGIVLGEGAAIFVLEELEHAKARGAAIYGEINGYGACFDPGSRNIYNPRARGAAEAVSEALKSAEINTDEIDYISASANSTIDCDIMETRAVKQVFGYKAGSIPISSIKSMIGESFSASGAMNFAASLGIIKNDFIPPTINYETPDARCDLDYVPNEARTAKIKRILVNSFSPTGSNSSLVVSRFG